MNPNDLIQDRYRLQEPLGKGGMAEVWSAHDQRLDRLVAIKVLSQQFHDDPEWLVRFFSEAQSVARISHPNVVSVLDFGEYEGRPYLVMELAPGGSLAEMVGDPVLPERATEIVAEAAKGAGAAHAGGVIHRDIKPANILISDGGRAELADFGIAAAHGGERLTATGLAIGSPHYVSPEQASGRAATPRSDVYSLGIVLYELLTGKRPFEGDNATAIAIAHVEQKPEPPSGHVPGLDPALDALVLRCLAKDPDARFDNGAELAAALENPNLVAATTVGASADLDGSEAGYWIEPPSLWKRGAVAVGILALTLGLGAAIVWASSRNQIPRPISRDLETSDQGVFERARKKPSPTASSGGLVSSVTKPTPTPTQEDEPAPTETDGDPTVTVVGEEERDKPTPEPTTEPTPEPTPEPTTEPTPAPTSEPEPEP
jgi:serine/threonine-protein kinase